jgi:hypothetical protein
VAEEHEARLELLDDLAQGERVRVGGVISELRGFDAQNLADLSRRQFLSQSRGAAAQNDGGNRPAHILGQRLAGRQRLPGGADQLALLVLRENQNLVRHSS